MPDRNYRKLGFEILIERRDNAPHCTDLKTRETAVGARRRKWPAPKVKKRFAASDR